MREDTIVEQATAKITHGDVEMVRRFSAEFRRADESYVSALSLMAPVFELPLSDVTVVDGEAVLECRVATTPAAEVTWYVENVEIRQTDDYHIVFTADGWCRLIIRDVMLKDEAKYNGPGCQRSGHLHRYSLPHRFTGNYRGEDGKGAVDLGHGDSQDSTR